MRAVAEKNRQKVKSRHKKRPQERKPKKPDNMKSRKVNQYKAKFVTIESACTKMDSFRNQDDFLKWTEQFLDDDKMVRWDIIIIQLHFLKAREYFDCYFVKPLKIKGISISKIIRTIATILGK